MSSFRCDRAIHWVNVKIILRVAIDDSIGQIPILPFVAISSDHSSNHQRRFGGIALQDFTGDVHRWRRIDNGRMIIDIDHTNRHIDLIRMSIIIISCKHGEMIDWMVLEVESNLAE